MPRHATSGSFKKGDPRIDRSGSKRGHRSFSTDFEEAVKQIAEANKITPSEARVALMKRGYSEASKGNYSFWSYINNQVYGPPPTKVEGVDQPIELKITWGPSKK